MKLIRVDVENFGTLSNFKYDFNAGLNIIKEENGFGKSTLAAFIKAMFYGMNNSKSQSLSENTRKKYLPWNGGRYGGSLEFEFNSKEYRIERFFGATLKKDTVRVISLMTNKDTADFINVNEIGREIFGLDVTSYEKSSFIPQDNSELFITDDLRAKLSDLIETSKDSLGFDEAIAVLEKKKNGYKLNKSKGLIVEVENEVNKLKEDLELLNNKYNSLGEKKESIENQKIEINELRNKIYLLKNRISKNNESKVLREIKNQYDSLCEDIRSMEEKIEKLEKLCIPTPESISEIKEKVDSYNKQKLSLQNLIQDDCHKEYKNFKDDVISDVTEEDIESIEKLVNSYNELKDINSGSEKLDEYKKLKDKFSDEELFKKELESVKKVLKNNIYTYDFSALILMFASFSLATAIDNNALLSNMLFVLSGLFLIIFIILFVIRFKQKGNNKKNVIAIEFINKYGTIGNNRVSDVKNIEDSFNKYIILKDILEKDYEIENINILKKKELENSLNEKFFKLGIDSVNYVNGLSQLKFKYLSYKKTEEEVATNKIKQEEINEALNGYIVDLDKLFKTYCIDGSDYENNLFILNKRHSDYKSYKVELVKLIEKKNQYVNEKNITLEMFIDLSEEISEDLETELAALEIELQSGITALTKEEKDYNILLDECEEISDLEFAIESKNELKKNYQKQYDLIETTIKYLKISKDNLTSAYLKPMENSFEKYLSLIDSSFKDVIITSDFKIEAKRYGESRGLGYFSTGYQELLNVCIRLALVDNLYKIDKPAIILDDPFANLDDDKLNNAKDLLNKISSEYQVIYLVCHSSRA